MNSDNAPKKILIVEDEPDIVEFYSKILSDDCEILIASSGASALKQMRTTEGIDVVILDYKLPDMSGIEVLKEMKKMRPSVPVIIVTAFGDEDVAVKSFRHGARDYIKKPFSGSDLRRRIDFYVSCKSIGEGPRRSASYDDQHGQTGINHACTTSSNVFKIQKALKYIDDNYATKISLGVAAQESCMSKYHFARIFKKVTGKTFQEYVNSRRIEKAKEIIKKSSMTITNAAAAAGYSDLRHFEKMFKKSTDLTPSQYKTFPSNANEQDTPH